MNFNVLDKIIKFDSVSINIKDITRIDPILVDKKIVEIAKNRIKIKPSFAGDRMVYLVFYENKIYITLDLKKLKIKFKIYSDAIGAILNWGIIPYPYTPFENIYRLSIGQNCIIELQSSKLLVSVNQLHFFNKNEIMNPNNYDEKEFENIFFNFFEKNIKNSEETISMTSAGKDSTLIAIICSKLGYNRINFLTYNDKSTLDETTFSEKICNKLNLKLKKINSDINNNFFEKSEIFFKNADFPVVDNATIPYMISTLQINNNISQVIDGMGNDIYFGHILNRKSKIKKFLNSFGKYLTNYDNKLSRISYLKYLFRPSQLRYMPANYLSSLELKNILDFEYKSNWILEHFKININDLEEMYYKSLTRGIHYDFGVAMEKNRFVCSGFSAKPFFPWADETIAKYIFNLKEKYKFKNYTNKIFLREYLNKKINYNDYKIPKTGFGFESSKFILTNWKNIFEEIIECKYLNKQKTEIFLKKNNILLKNDSRYGTGIIGLYIVSRWLNKCKLIN